MQPQQQTQQESEALARRNRYVEDHLALVDTLAKSLMQRLPPCFEFDDLRQSGCLGLIDAATKYREEMGVPFRYYAAWRIRGQMLESVRRRHWREAMALPITADILEIPGAGAESVERSIEHGDRRRLVAEALESVQPAERKVIEIYYRREQKLAGVGRAFGIRQSRSSQLLHNARRSVERELAWRGLRAA